MRTPKQLTFKKVNGWGGKRKGSGRKNKTGQPGHLSRDKVDFKKPLHITLRLKEGLKSLRTPKMLEQFQLCIEKAKGLNVIHFSLESNHIHIFAESKNNQNLEKGMKSLGCRLGKAIRKYCGGKGSVFQGRYHLHVLKSPSETKNALTYVLLNHSKHQKLIPYNDRYSSANHFHDWKKLLGRNVGPILEDGEGRNKTIPSYLSSPKSWLAKTGWAHASPAAI